ncbi:hypothetical protein GCK72_003755 [Caenorhabditis remanei]|uniref:F-box domain-containing protein n=1 Tax=Caenorhabditis remanei TaxID=31234 RepID=A0A6A5H7K8_CAERE|nr:hypothetical protein GCK72_003755 [Caenorhabditis remanei]KAF1763810.1 hypothetical protein GCK72_003755 [Caenorhabditis remanei]
MFTLWHIQLFNRKDATFPLQNLPHLAMNEVIKLMDPLEQISLALLSKKMNTYVRCSRPQIADHCEVNLTDGNAVLTIPEVIEYSRKQISNWNNKTSIFTNFWPDNKKKLTSNTMKIVEKIQMAFPKITFSLTLHSNDLKNNDIMDALLNKTWKKVTVDGGELKADDLDKIMEMDNSNNNFVFKNTTFPTNYRHKNAFNFASIAYNDAQWVQIDDLLTLTDNQIVRLGQTAFEPQDLNLLLKTWQRSPHDMFGILTLRNNELNLDETFKDLVTLTVEHTYFYSVLLSADNSSNNIDPPILAKKSLEDELATLDEGSVRRDEIIAEIENLLTQLTMDEVYFEDGKAKMTNPATLYLIVLHVQARHAWKGV